MTRHEFINKYNCKQWFHPTTKESRFYLDLSQAMPQRNISRQIKNTVKIWLDSSNKLHIQGTVEHYADNCISDAASII